MITHKFTEEELKYLRPVEAVRYALEMQVKTHIYGVVFPRLGIKEGQKVTYDILEKGELKVK